MVNIPLRRLLGDWYHDDVLVEIWDCDRVLMMSNGEPIMMPATPERYPAQKSAIIYVG